MQTRAQKIVQQLEKELACMGPDSIKSMQSRVQSLPTMVQRHGCWQVLRFLRSKGGGDETLADLLAAGVAAGLDPEDSREATAEDLEKHLEIDIFNAMRYRDAALETAVWLKRLIEVRAKTAKAARDGDGKLA